MLKRLAAFTFAIAGTAALATFGAALLAHDEGAHTPTLPVWDGWPRPQTPMRVAIASP